MSPIKKKQKALQKEVIEFDISKPSVVKPSEVASLTDLPFEYTPNENQTLIKFTMVHTLPSVNVKGRAVSYPTQRNSIQSIHYNPVNLEHIMTSNPGFYDEDLILGVMLWATIEDIPGNPVVPDKPVPTVVYAVLWNRIELVESIIRDVETGFTTWRVSFEMSPRRSEDEIKVGDSYTPWSEADEKLLSKIGPYSTGSIDGEQVVLVLGGRHGYVDYWGAALTMFPAEKINPEIEISEIASLAKKRIRIDIPRDLGSSKTCKQEPAAQTASDPASQETLQQTTNGGGADMDKEQLKKELEKQMASLSPALQSAINSSGLTADKAKSLVDAFQAELKGKSEELASAIEKKYAEGFVPVADKDTAVEAAVTKALEEKIPQETASAVEKALKDEIPKARESWEKEQETHRSREKAIEEANIPLTDARREKIKTFGVDEAGQKAFDGYLDELKEVAALAKKTTKATTKSQTASQGQSETASIGGLLNGNPATDAEESELVPAAFFN